MSPSAPAWNAEHGSPLASSLATTTGEVVIWSMAVLAAIAALTWVLAYVRRRLIRGDYRAPEGLTLEQLDALRREGAITEEEYRRARRVVLGLSPADAGGRPTRLPDGGAHGRDAPGGR